MDDGLICIKCEYTVFLDPKKDICYKTGGLYCRKLREIVGKYDPCRVKEKPGAKKKKKKKKTIVD